MEKIFFGERYLEMYENGEQLDRTAFHELVHYFDAMDKVTLRRAGPLRASVVASGAVGSLPTVVLAMSLLLCGCGAAQRTCVDQRTSMETNSAAQVLQAVLDDHRIAPFLHAEVPGRVPVRVVWNLAGPPIDRVVKFGQPVEVSRSKYVEDAAVIQLGTFVVLNKEAWVSLEYPIEGISAEFHLREGADGWCVVNGQVAEH